MNFGSPSLDIREPLNTNAMSVVALRISTGRRVTVRGQWWLWIYHCYWRLSGNDLPAVTDSSSLRRIERATKHLDGQKLVSVAVEPDTGATRFVFDLGSILHCRRCERDSSDELWMLYKPNGYVLSVLGNGTFSHQRSTKSNS
jgi:hypothetical protein